MADSAEDKQVLGLPFDNQSLLPTLQKPPATTNQDIVIQLTTAGNEEDWDSLEDNELIFSLDKDEDGGAVIFTTEKSSSENGKNAEDGLRSTFHMPTSPPSPSVSGSLVDLSCSAGFFFPQTSPSNTDSSLVPKPFMNLVKSLSTEIEPKEATSLKPRPLLNLVKSISTEISRHEPEVTQSKSDSKLNLHLWRQLTQPKGRNGDSKTAPPSPSISPSESKGGFFKVPEVEAKLEDTKRKFSEAMQEPFSMLSKIIGDENSGSPKQKQGASDSPGPSSQTNGDLGGDIAGSKNSRKGGECDRLSICETPVRHAKRSPSKPCLSQEPKRKLGSDGSRYEICTYGDVMQVVEIEHSIESARVESGELSPELSRELGSLQTSQPVPSKCLFCIATLAYSYFVLPLPSYISGLCLGLACGVMVGLVVILLLAPRNSMHFARKLPSAHDCLQSEFRIKEHKEPDVLKGWMNEMYVYDPETYLPSLTHSVFITLEGSTLRLSYPKNNISRWATFDEPRHDAVFASHRTVKLAESKVFLVPPALARKRIWNKKYPICILLTEQEESKTGSQGEKEAEEQRTLSDTPKRASPEPSARPSTAEASRGMLYLFGRTGRDKEEWFQHFQMPPDLSPRTRRTPVDVAPSLVLYSGGSSRGSTEDIASLFRLRDLAGSVRQKILLDYNTYMAHFILSESSSPLLSPCHSAASSPNVKRKFPRDQLGGSSEAQPAWINALIGRIFWDFLREKYWADQVAYKIQKKLSKIKLPYFMNELTLTELDMGTSLPQILSTSKPSVNHRGLWMNLEVTYNGMLQMTLETKMNLCKLGKKAMGDKDSLLEPGREGSKPRVLLLADSDEESSSAGSSDEEEDPPTEPQWILGDKATPTGTESHVGGNSTSRKILRFVDKIAKSKYFQKATENEFIKKKIEEVSNTPLLLTVEVQELSGTLAVNIPPPPTDRLWYSFQIPPRLDLKVRPKLGEREVTFSHVTEWIEKKLQHEFQKVFVMPNMDDLYLPIMHSGMDNLVQSWQSPAEPSRQPSEESLEKTEPLASSAAE
ncbi:TEX2 protein, partial [Polyodon spathula]|nr:TEX2 protein [Polyodon spathula]